MIAIILAGGKGTRLSPIMFPKTLIPINGVTILQRLMEHLMGDMETKSVNKIIVCTGYRADDVEASIDAHGWLEEHVRVSDGGEGTPMGARLLKARELTDGGRVLICYGDELADVDVKALLKKHKDAAITFAAAYTKVPGGTVGGEPGHATRIIDEAGRYINIGFAVIEPKCWSLLKPEDGLSDWINRVSETMNVQVYYHEGKRATVNSLADLQYAEEVWR